MRRSIQPYIPPILYRAKNRLRESLSGLLPDRHLRVSGHAIRIPPEHPLKTHLENIRLYNAFLPVLAGSLEKDGAVVDVGANVGDTAISLLPFCRNEVICVEPSDRYAGYLERNIGSLPPEDRQRVRILKNMIGTGGLSGTLAHERGTAFLRADGAANTSIVALDDLLGMEQPVSLIKVDTDGFDFDVLMSAKKIIESSQPVLFWENQIDHAFQLEGYRRLYEWLAETGYRHICVFDNFGAILCRTQEFGVVADMTDYLYHRKAHGGMHTFAYTDILACTDRDLGIFQTSVERYLRDHMMK